MADNVISVIEDIESKGILTISDEERNVIFENLKESMPDFNLITIDAFNDLIRTYINFQSHTTTSPLVAFILLSLFKYSFIIPVIEIDRKALHKIKDTVHLKTTNKQTCYLSRKNQYIEYINPSGHSIDIYALAEEPIVFGKLTNEDIRLLTNGFLSIIDVSKARMTIGGNVNNIHTQQHQHQQQHLHPNNHHLIHPHTVHPHKIHQLDSKELTILKDQLFDKLQSIYSLHQNAFVYAVYNIGLNSGKFPIVFVNADIDKQILQEFKKLKRLSHTPTFDYKSILNTNVTLTKFGKLFRAVYPIYNNQHLHDLFVTSAIILHEYFSTHTHEKFIERMENANIRNAAMIQFANARNKEYNKLQIIYKAMEATLDSKRWMKVKDVLAKSRYNSTSIFDFVTSAEKTMITSKIKSIEMRLHNIFNNKCPHVKALQKLRASSSVSDEKRALSSLMSFMDRDDKHNKDHHDKSDRKHTHYIHKITNTDYIKCNNCKLDLICPHELTLADMTAKQISYASIRVVLTKYQSTLTASDDNTYAYYCKICGEKIANDDDFDDVYDKENTGEIADELRVLIYDEILSAANYLISKVLINRKNLYNEISKKIYDYIYSIEKTLIKHKLDTDSEVRIKLRLYSNIYIWAYMIHIVALNQQLSIGNSKFFDAPAKKTTNMLEFAINTMIKDKKGIIIAAGANVDFIKSKLIKAYQQVSGEGNLIIITTSPMEVNYMTLMHDPIYSYLYHMYWNNKDYDKNYEQRKTKKSTIPSFESVETVLGKSINSRVKDPTSLPNGIFDGYDYMHNATDVPLLSVILEDAYAASAQTKKHLPSWQALGASNSKESFMILFKYITEGQYRKVFGEITYDAWQKFHKWEEIFIDKVNRYFVNFYQVTLSNTDNKYIEEPFALSDLYDETGKKHVWNKYVYDDANKQITLTNSEIIVMVFNRTNTYNPEIIDMVSSRGVKYSERNQLNENKIKKNLDRKNAIENFYLYYRIRCLKSLTHEFKNNKCIFCKIENQFFRNNFDQSAIDFYEANDEIYTNDIAKERLDNVEAIKSEIKSRIDIANLPAKLSIKRLDDWSFDFNVINYLHKHFELNKSILTLLGLSIGEEWENIKKGISNTDLNEAVDLRLLIINSYIISTIDEFSKFKYYKNLIHPPKYLTALIETHSIQTANLQKLADINIGTYWKDIEYIRKNKSTDVIPLFALEQLYTIIINIHKQSSTGDDFAKHMIKKLIKNDSLSANADLDDIKIFNNKYITQVAERVEEEIKTETKAEAAMTGEEQPQERVNAEGDVIEEADDVGNTDAPLDLSSFDLEDDAVDGDIIHVED